MINRISVDNEVGITGHEEIQGINLTKYQSTKKWEWSHLRDGHSYSVIPDVFVYAFSLAIFLVVLLPAFQEDVSNFWRPFACSFLAICVQVATDLMIPIYHAINTQDFRHLRPMYASHNLLIIYIFLPISDNVIVSLMGLMTSVCYVMVMVFVSYSSDDHIIIKVLSESFFLLCINIIGIYFRITNEIDIRRNILDRRECVQKNLSLKYERNQEKELLLSILPEHIAEKMEKDIKHMIKKLNERERTKNKLYAEKHSNVSILYADVVRYTQMTSQLPVRTLVETLHELFVKFDEASIEHNVLRIKFLGDCYYGVSGVPIKDKRHAKNCVDLGLRMIRDIRELRASRKINIDMRIGVHSGSIIGGVMGSCKWQYDIWSKDVVIANKIESTGVTGKVHITAQTLELLHGEYSYEEGTINARNDEFLVKNNIKTFLITPKKTSVVNDMQIRKVSKDRSNVNHTKPDDMSTISEIAAANRKNFMMNSMEQFRDIMKQTNIEMELELERMPIGKFQLMKYVTQRKLTTPVPSRTFYGSGSISEFEDFSYQAKKINKPSKLLLRFANPSWEWSFLNQADVLLKYSVFMSCIVLLTIFSIQVLNQSNGILFYWCTTVSALLIIAIVPFVWFKKIWDFIKPVHDSDGSMVVPPRNRLLKALYDFSFDIMSNAYWRTAIYLVVVIVLTVVSLLHLVECYEMECQDSKCNDNYEDYSKFSTCLNSWSVTQCLVLSICMCFLFLRIHFLLKLAVAAIINAVYYYIIFYWVEYIYDDSATANPAMDSKLAHFLKVAVSTVIFHIIDRQSEYILRVGFIWKQKLAEKKRTSMITKETNKILVHNILPVHVAELYLNSQIKNELYNEEYESVAVMFATIMNFDTSSNTIDGESNELKSLNEIICAFDEKILTKTGRIKIEKIKVAGWSYMCACGLEPGQSDSNSSTLKGIYDGRRSLAINSIILRNQLSPRVHKMSVRQSNNVVITLVEFALELMRVLKKISEENENFKDKPPLQLRVGISHGKVMAGVVGALKPLYDIWGNSVNMASRMDSTGIPGKIQVTKETANVLKCFGIECQFRGEINVKGKGLIPTFFVSINESLEFEKDNDTDTQAQSLKTNLNSLRNHL
ncbi:CLUMA_CG019587, isoform A [Clunio marinus]|uniref:adenylate cyclase n=1 Tax=Clunio marinus TaxID=568069 RepID=A0A1J1J4K1_9DIPT|nr:CLUMA_CG019587, isoform A [Clunio marinus]